MRVLIRRRFTDVPPTGDATTMSNWRLAASLIRGAVNSGLGALRLREPLGRGICGSHEYTGATCLFGESGIQLQQAERTIQCVF
jgi:hypothetical protein